jgi:hypothetical protein
MDWINERSRGPKTYFPTPQGKRNAWWRNKQESQSVTFLFSVLAAILSPGFWTVLWNTFFCYETPRCQVG